MNDKFAVDIATRVQEFVKAQPQANAVEHQRAPLGPLRCTPTKGTGPDTAKHPAGGIELTGPSGASTWP